ncbi:hypothetical protein CFC21_028487 [Triticum aestivum]|uniref:MATH domain-containing protein n=3 Tax=Triticinae TaxID=1648030 RepID=A0A9R1EQ76_WHEAT|nr:BTB/POZ and MATH domain-containing protein 3-like [Aegilops tauschii subsp. strangulata]KAF7014498.1 hypothetical protein CFC21_028485 [Triticum aestivum]KAF7014500.1 hypothetical protein CFC21_028487 [Triticum aestivum]
MGNTAAAASAAAAAAAPSEFHLFEVVGYSRAKDLPTGMAIESSPFMLGGYRWVIDIFPNGRVPGDADFMALSFTLIQDVTRPLKVHALFTFTDQVAYQDPRVVRTSPMTHVPSRVCIGSPRYIAREAFERSKHLKNDCFTVRWELIIVEDGLQH